MERVLLEFVNIFVLLQMKNNKHYCRAEIPKQRQKN